MSDVIYLDNNATTAVAPQVREAMEPFLTELYGNPSSIHTFGGQVAKHVDIARQQVAELLACHPAEVLFTSCGTESDNAAIRSALPVNPHRKNIVTTRVEHPAVRNVCHTLERPAPIGFDNRVIELPVDQYGELNLPDVDNALDEKVAVASIMWANNETGVIFPVETIADMCRDRGILFHTDAVQAVGKVPIHLEGTAIDMLSLSGHKLHAPKGIGALYLRKGSRFMPFMMGGHQERGRRAGTENEP